MLVATMGGIAGLAAILGPSRHEPPPQHVFAIALNIAGIDLSARVSIR
jgi:hypothetical protein